jgi:hypothetical protein
MLNTTFLLGPGNCEYTPPQTLWSLRAEAKCLVIPILEARIQVVAIAYPVLYKGDFGPVFFRNRKLSAIDRARTPNMDFVGKG